jgi:hypothetical protein
MVFMESLHVTLQDTVEGFALQMSIIVLFEQMKSGDFKDKSGKISD